MTPPARVQSAIELLDLIIAAARDNGAAADAIIAGWFRDHRFAGSKDKAAIRALVYRAIRAFGERPETARAAIVALADADPELASLFDGTRHAPAPIVAGEPRAQTGAIPPWLAPLIPASEHEALLARAPLDLRVNRLRSDVASVAALLPGAQAIAGLPDALRLGEPIPLAGRPELQGLVEVQDAGSQMIATACETQPGQTVVDLCAGAGGKTLALAAAMDNRGRLVAADTDRGRLRQLEPRARRAGASIVELRLLDPGREPDALLDLQSAADCVLVDAPCSGSGTWRRNPELRWRLTPARLDLVVALQARLITLGAEMVRPGGMLVYAVCSLIEREGEAQAADLAARSGWSLELSRMMTPSRDETDGFYFARFRRPC